MRHDGSDRDDMYICVICPTGSMHKKTIQSHLDRGKHHERLKEIASKVDGIYLQGKTG